MRLTQRASSGLWVPEAPQVITQRRDGPIVDHLGVRVLARHWGGYGGRGSTVRASSLHPRETSGMTVLVNDNMHTDYTNRASGVFTGTSNVAHWTIGAGYPGAPEDGPPGDGNFGGLYKEFPLAGAQLKDEIYFEFEIQTSANYQWHISQTKLAWLGLVGETGGDLGVSFVIAAGDVDANHGLVIYQQYPVGNQINSTTVIPVGSRARIALWAKTSTGANSDGFMHTYVNDVLAGSNTALNMGAAKFAGLRVDPYWGGQDDTKTVSDWIEYFSYYMSGK